MNFECSLVFFFLFVFEQILFCQAQRLKEWLSLVLAFWFFDFTLKLALKCGMMYVTWNTRSMRQKAKEPSPYIYKIDNNRIVSTWASNWYPRFVDADAMLLCQSANRLTFILSFFPHYLDFSTYFSLELLFVWFRDDDFFFYCD